MPYISFATEINHFPYLSRLQKIIFTMGQKARASFIERQNNTNIEADVIILGSSLPGLVIAQKLRKKFGKSINIVVLDLSTPKRAPSKGNVAFQDVSDEEDEDEDSAGLDITRRPVDNVAKYFLSKFAKEFGIPLPDTIVNPGLVKSHLNKLFQYRNGNTVKCTNDYHDFDYLNVFERFELNQYQNLLDQDARDLFQDNRVSSDADKKKLLYYDQTTMEWHICTSLLFSTSREIIRTTVRLVCGAPSHSVSVLFYLHQCHRTSSARNHLDGNNTRFREKLFGYCRKQVANKMQQSISDITLPAKPIQKIRCLSEEQVILETIKGDTNYICNLLAMALRPDELLKIVVEEQLLSEKEAEIVGRMSLGKVKKFLIQYDENFWEREGYSGDILSIRGPIIWATERPRMSNTGSNEKYAGLIGYLIVKDNVQNSREAVLEQLAKLFGEEASKPVNYKESDISDIFVPRCTDYVAIHKFTTTGGGKSAVEWGAMDIFTDGDVAAALEAGHNAYLHVLMSLRPQAQTYEEVVINEWPTVLDDGPIARWLTHLNCISSMRLAAYATAIYIGIRLIQSYMRK